MLGMQPGVSFRDDNKPNFHDNRSPTKQLGWSLHVVIQRLLKHIKVEAKEFLASFTRLSSDRDDLQMLARSLSFEEELAHCRPDQPKIQTELLGHSLMLVRSCSFARTAHLLTHFAHF